MLFTEVCVCQRNLLPRAPHQPHQDTKQLLHDKLTRDTVIINNRHPTTHPAGRSLLGHTTPSPVAPCGHIPSCSCGIIVVHMEILCMSFTLMRFLIQENQNWPEGHILELWLSTNVWCRCEHDVWQACASLILYLLLLLLEAVLHAFAWGYFSCFICAYLFSDLQNALTHIEIHF